MKKFVVKPRNPKGKGHSRIQVYLGVHAERFHAVADKSRLTASQLAKQMIGHCLKGGDRG